MIRKPKHIMAMMDLNKHEFDEAVTRNSALSLADKQLRWKAFLADQQPLMSELKMSRRIAAEEAVNADLRAYKLVKPLKGNAA